MNNAENEVTFCSMHKYQPIEWVDCWNCIGTGYSHHDCGEDSCVCADPEPNVRCVQCSGHGCYQACPACMPEEEYEARYA